MHVYTLLRGRGMLVDRFKQNWEDVFLPQQTKDGNTLFTQVIPRRVELVEWIFPEKFLGSMLKTWYPPTGSVQEYVKKPLVFAGVRKALGCSKLPKVDMTNSEVLTCRGGEALQIPWVANHLIGIKKDKFGEDGLELL